MGVKEPVHDTDDDFYAIILGSMPTSFESYISALSATTRALGKLLSPDDLMDALNEEHDRRVLHRGNRKGETSDVALSANDSQGRPVIKCFNCKNKGHKKADCWAPGGGKEGQGPKRKQGASENANTAKAEKTEAWIAYTDFLDDDGDMPLLQPVSDSESEESDGEEDEEDEEDEYDEDEDQATENAMLTYDQPGTKTTLFDSGAT